MDAQSERQERAHGRAAEARVRHARTRAGPAAAGDKAQGLRAAGRRREQRLGGLAGCLRFKFQPKRSHRNSARTNVQSTLVAWAQAASGLPGTDVLLRAERGQGSPTLNSCTESTGNSDLNKMPKMFGCSQIHQLQNCFSRKKKKIEAQDRPRSCRLPRRPDARARLAGLRSSICPQQGRAPWFTARSRGRSRLGWTPAPGLPVRAP